jgi:hypothetical protein
LIERLFGAETPEQARIRWLADANQGFNEYMLEQVNNGVSPYEAFNNYPNAVYTAFLKAYISLIGLAGLR